MTMPTGNEPIKKYRMKVDGKRTDNSVEMRMVPVDQVHYDADYQRSVDQKWITDHMPFLPEQAGTVVLSRRGGRLWCVDGRHRINLADLSEVKEVRAFVIHDMTKQEEASLFVRLQRERRALSAWDLFRAEMAAGEPQTLEMVNALNRAGFRIDQKTSGDPHVITAVDSVRFVYRLGGAQIIDDTLRLITDSMWLNLDRALSGPILKGLAIFLQSEQEKPTYDAERTLKKLRACAPTYLLLMAQQIAINRRSASVSATNVAEAVVQLYNERLANATKLPPITINRRKRPVAKSRKA
ncbi:MAG: hypothetical protein E4H24_05125 [Thermomicrobiales bacterium]|nr:MAG: hypothetical protein E4H24_05125 [Thermomicrobiales bacterium]